MGQPEFLNKEQQQCHELTGSAIMPAVVYKGKLIPRRMLGSDLSDYMTSDTVESIREPNLPNR